MLRIKDLREDNDYTQEDIAQLLNCKQNTYQQYESEKRQIPIDALKKLAELYKTSLDYLTCFTDEIKPYPRKKWNNVEKIPNFSLLFIKKVIYYNSMF